MTSVLPRVFAGAACLVLAGAVASAQSIQRERSIQRAALDAIEGAPLPEGSFESLKDWSAEETIGEAMGDAKIVVIGVVSMLEPKSWLTLSKLKRMQEDFGDRGVYVAAIHPDLGWDQMLEKIGSGEVTIPVARDEFGALARVLRADDYPDLYVLDARGNLAYADVHTGSLRDAIERLVRSPGAARAPDPAPVSTPEPKAGDPRAPRDARDEGAAPPVLVEADAGAYASADWPEHASKAPNSIQDMHGEPLPMQLGEHEQWISGETDISGRALLIYFWADYCGLACRGTHPSMQSLHESLGPQLAVIGVGVYGSREEFVSKVAALRETYPQMYDEKATLFEEIGVRNVPHALLVSTDGVVRWQGNPYNNPELEKAARKLVAVDPGLGG